jgi:protein phosphatase
MPWSQKAQQLLLQQYAPVGTVGVQALSAAKALLAEAIPRVHDLEELSSRTEQRLKAVKQYVREYHRYCWPVASIGDLKLAPFHLLASEGAVHTDKTHIWHLEMIGKLCAADEQLLVRTPFQAVDLNDLESCAAATRWWTELTTGGNEGMVVKPADFLAKGTKGYVQPAIKCRGAEYLRIIYGPEYLLPENLERLRSRAVGAKRSLASREFALGIEALDRFVRKEPLRRVHECIFGVLALESEPVDPRL